MRTAVALLVNLHINLESSWKRQTLELVRRHTGGRAVLHQGDLTYAVVTSGLSGDRIQVIRRL
jgi:lipoate-protein ligase A